METQLIEIKADTVFYKPELHCWQKDGLYFALDPDSPNWVSTDERGKNILDLIDGKNPVSEILRLYSQKTGLDYGKTWRDIHSFLREAERKEIISPKPFNRPPYEGRARHLKMGKLKEFWIHLLQTCNLSCSHCLVSSDPHGEKGESKDFYLKAIDEAFDLGVRRFYFTGGEPFIYDGIFDLISHIVEAKKAELIVLTNATLLQGERLRKIEKFDPNLLKFQVSLDGTTSEINDPIRGAGVFKKASQGLLNLSRLGFEASLTAVVTKSNIEDLKNLPKIAKELGAKSVHLMWLHKRGRILNSDENGNPPSNTELLDLTRHVRSAAKEYGIVFDNFESILSRINGKAGVKYDLGNLCWESLCLYRDGGVYPSAATAGISTLELGNAKSSRLAALWEKSSVAQLFRETSVIQKRSLLNHPFRFLSGGGDMEHSYFFSSNGTEGSILADDPYHELYVDMIKDAIAELALRAQKSQNMKSGFNPPTIYHAMGDGGISCSEDAQDWLIGHEVKPTRFLHTNCVLSFDVEKPYRIVQKFYGQAANEPQKELCCPVKYDEAEVGHIPKDVLDRFYGCGSPISEAQITPGETILDLGSGAGIDCFIAAKKTGPKGRVIGVDMTSEMLAVARRCQKDVASALGYDVVDFKEGFLEKIPTKDKSVDIVTSNCVINLSPDKAKVFSEIWRILKDNGRMVVADIVSENPVPLNLQAHKDLWRECISGSLSEAEFLAGLERAGFYGIRVLKKTFWKEVEGYPFYSITVRGFKYEKKSACSFIGQKAVYWGPYKAVIDEEGHLFPRGELVEVCTDTASKLAAPPYAGDFSVIKSSESLEKPPVPEGACCSPEKACC